ncbi:glycosyltransferase [Flavobacteriales bacterium]|nr:glycosyltransferase [Flavobacteriales bacterium]
MDERKRHPVRRLRILISVDWFPPAFRAGGPIRSAYNLCALLSENHDVWVITGSHDLGEQQALDVSLDAWNVVQVNNDSVQVRYCRPGSLDRRGWVQLLEEIKPDFLHLNSMFSRNHSLIPLRIVRNRPDVRVVLAPRGMLGDAALAIKPLKKRVFLSFARMLDLFKGVTWHASNSNEAKEVRSHFIAAHVCVAQNLPTSLPSENPDRSADHWRVVVIGRIHRVKNLDFGLKALLKASSDRPLELDFIGPIEDEAYQRELASLAAAQKEVKVRFLGGMPPSMLANHFQTAHFLLSSTMQENFGHSIVEAWAHGCPVLISDRTPWLGLQEKGIGWDWPLDEEAWKSGLSAAFGMEEGIWKVMSEKARDFFKSHVRNDAAEKANLELFRP